MAKGKRTEKNMGKAELRAEVWRKYLLEKFESYHGVTKQKDIAAMIGCTPGRVTDYLGDPQKLGRRSVDRIASCFGFQTGEYILREWQSLNHRQGGSDEEPVRRPQSKRPDYAKASKRAIYDQHLEESELLGEAEALSTAFMTSMLNRQFPQAAVYIDKSEALPENASDPVFRAMNLHRRFRLLSAAGCTNTDVLRDLLQRAIQLLSDEQISADTRYRVSTMRIAVMCDQVSFYCERLSYQNIDHIRTLKRLYESMRSLLPTAETPIARANVYLKCAQLQACLGNIESAEKLLESGRKEAAGSLWEYHVKIVELILLRAKGERAAAMDHAIELTSDRAELRDEFHLRLIQLHMVEMTLGINRYEKPAPDSGAGSNDGES